MSLLIKKRQILAATLVIALVAATGVNWYYSQNGFGTEYDLTTSAEEVSGNLGDSLFVAGTTSNEQQTTASAEQKVPDEYFAEAKLKRKESDDEIIDSIEEILENEKLDSAQKAKITTLLETYQKDVKAQTDAENLIKAKTNSECLVVINNEKCQVILEKNTLNDTLVLQITEIIAKNTNISAENLTIIEIK